jgi:trigger factor
MQTTKKQIDDTTVELTASAEQELLDNVKQQVLKKLGAQVRLPGFRLGKAPASMVEKNVDQARLQNDFLEQAVQQLYLAAIDKENVRPVTQPEVSVSKFVPFTTLEISAKIETVGEVKLADYKKIKKAKPAVKVTEKDIDGVVESLRQRVADKKAVNRTAKSGDEVTIDFSGTDAKTGQPISGADAKGYPLLLGSNSFIPGFEDDIIGMKPGEDKTFDITFPKDYGVKALQGKKVSFAVHLITVQEVTLPKADDDFATKAGPFSSLKELRGDIKGQLKSERQQEADSQYQNELLEDVAKKSSVAIPASLVDEEIQRMEQQDRQNATYRGQTWPEYLEAQELSEDTYKEAQRPAAELRVKAGLVLAEIADKEQINITDEEVDRQINLLKGRYQQDPKMQAELAKPENRRDIASRLLSEKTIGKLEEYAASSK